MLSGLMRRRLRGGSHEVRVGIVVQLAAYRPREAPGSAVSVSRFGLQPRLDREALEKSCQKFVAGLQRMRLARGMLAETRAAVTDPAAAP